MDLLREKLFEMQDGTYRNFQSKLIPEIEMERIIGIRFPTLRKFAKEFGKTDWVLDFMGSLPHYYFEENNLHMLLITQIKDYKICFAELKKFLPYIDNWATCDITPPACFEKHKEELLSEIKWMLCAKDPYTVRFAVGLLMRFYLKDDFKEEYLQMVASINSEEYYVKMMVAWYFATALVFQWKAAVVYIEEHRLPEWTHKKTIQKAVESYRINEEQKAYLKTFR